MKEVTDRPLVEVRNFVSRLPVRAGSGLMLTPLVDVILLLLIFILLGSSLLQVPGFKVELPEVLEARFDTADKLVISMRRLSDGSEIFFNTKVIPDFHVLENELGKYKRTRSTRVRRPIVILRADKNVPLDDLTTIMDICRRQEITLFIVTEGRKVEVP